MVKIFIDFIKRINWKRLYLQEQWSLLAFYKSSYGEKLRGYKNVDSNRRCFILGNGPSLSVVDLEKLHESNEVCFAANRIYGIYDQTDWRPTYFVCQDDRIMEQIYKDMDEIIENSQGIFLAENVFKHDKRIISNSKVLPFFLRIYSKKKDCIEFSNDISRGISEGQTVVYTMAQIAIYMGFTEIYMLGVDHNFQVATQSDNSDEKNYFKGIKKIDNRKLYDAKPIQVEQSYMLLRRIAEENKVQIYNATRGGKLEIFERINFDSLF